MLVGAMQDLAKDATPHFAKAKKFYSSVAADLVAHGHAFDIFACALDQVNSLPDKPQ
jgi:protein transport protein SEC23